MEGYVCVCIYIYIANELEDSVSSVNHLKFLCRLTLISNKIHLCFFLMKNDKLRDVSPGQCLRINHAMQRSQVQSLV